MTIVRRVALLVLILVVLTSTSITLRPKARAAGCRPLICQQFDPQNSLDDWFWWWYWGCEQPPCEGGGFVSRRGR